MMPEPDTDLDSWVRPTVNHRGVMVKHLSSNSQAFIDFAAQAKMPVIDMGCAYGVATLPALEKGAKVIACDLEPQHLAEIVRVATEKEFTGLTTEVGRFPQDFQFEENSIAAFHSSFVFHFLTGDQVMEGLGKVRKWLIPGGKVFLNTGTRYMPFLRDFQAEYECRLQNGVRWPGEIDEDTIDRFADADFKTVQPPEAVPRFIHMFDKAILSRALNESGFTIEHIDYYNLDWPGKFASVYGNKDIPGLIAVVAHS